MSLPVTGDPWPWQDKRHSGVTSAGGFRTVIPGFRISHGTVGRLVLLRRGELFTRYETELIARFDLSERLTRPREGDREATWIRDDLALVRTADSTGSFAGPADVAFPFLDAVGLPRFSARERRADRRWAYDNTLRVFTGDSLSPNVALDYSIPSPSGRVSEPLDDPPSERFAVLSSQLEGFGGAVCVLRDESWAPFAEDVILRGIRGSEATSPPARELIRLIVVQEDVPDESLRVLAQWTSTRP
jgi:hypothetical protein